MVAVAIGEVERIAERRRRDNDDVRPISDDVKLVSFRRFKLPIYLHYGYGEYHMQAKLEDWLPVAANTLFKTQNWSLLQEFSAPVPKRCPKEALDSELAALCVLLLFIDIPRKMKRGIIRAFGNICFGPPFKATNMSTDQESVEKLLVRALNMGDTEVRRQVCLAIAFLASLCAVRYVTITFGSAIQDKLLQLVQSSDSNLTFPVLSAVTALCQASKEMKEECVRTEVKDSWLSNIISTRQDDKLILDRACFIVGFISCYAKVTEGLWDHLKKMFPIIFKMPFEAEIGIPRGASRAMFEITEFASPCQIKELVDLDGLKVLFDFLDLADCVTFYYTLTAIERILKVGDNDALKERLGKDNGDGEAGVEDVLRTRSGEGEGAGEAGEVVLGKDGEGKCGAGDENVLGKDGAGDEEVLGEGGEGKSDNEAEVSNSNSESESESEIEAEEGVREGEDSDSDSDSDSDNNDESEGEGDDESEGDTEGDIEGVAEENKYAKMIDGYRQGWRMLANGGGTYFVHRSIKSKARRLLKKYRPAVCATCFF